MEERLQNFMKMLYKVKMEYRDIIRESYEFAKQLLWEEALNQTRAGAPVQSVDVMEKAAVLLVAAYEREYAELIERQQRILVAAYEREYAGIVETLQERGGTL